MYRIAGETFHIEDGNFTRDRHRIGP